MSKSIEFGSKIARNLGVKKAFTSTLIHVHANSSNLFFLEANASDFTLDLILYEYGEDG